MLTNPVLGRGFASECPWMRERVLVCMCACVCVCVCVCMVICQATSLHTICIKSRVGEMPPREIEVLLTEGGEWMWSRQSQQVPNPWVYHWTMIWPPT